MCKDEFGAREIGYFSQVLERCQDNLASNFSSIIELIGDKEADSVLSPQNIEIYQRESNGIVDD